MRQLTLEELRETQMQILDYVDSFCRKNNIKYTLSGGTLLGAVRHGGYIPWDDDIDIQMLREDYVKFHSVWKQSNNPYYSLVSIENGNNMGYAFAKISDTRTITLVRGVERTGVYIDVFPLDKIKNDQDFRLRSWLKKRFYQRAFAAFYLTTTSDDSISIFKKIKYRVLSLGKDRKFWAERINCLAQKNNGVPCDYYYEMVAGMKCKKPIPTKIFDNYQYLQFEDRKYLAVSDFDQYLRLTFGDYMQLPPIEQRVRTHNFISFWKDEK